MAERRWRAGVELRLLRLLLLLGKLGALDDVLDQVLLSTTLFAIAPPHRSLVIASQTEMLAGLASGLSLFALLASQSTGEAS